MKFYILAILFLGAFVLNSCNTEAAESVANDFHKKLDAKDYDYIVSELADLDDVVTEADWHSFFEIVETWGPQSKREQQSTFNKQYKNGFTTIKLSYTFEVEEYGLMHERIVLVDRDGVYKIFKLLMNKDEQVVIDGSKGF